MDIRTAMTKASPAGLANHVEKMLKAGQPLADICAALGVNATFVAKVRRSAGLVKTTFGVARSGFRPMGMRKAYTPVETAKLDVLGKTKDLAKALRKEDSATYVPRLVKQLIDMGEDEKTIRACFKADQQSMVSEVLQAYRK